MYDGKVTPLLKKFRDELSKKQPYLRKDVIKDPLDEAEHVLGYIYHKIYVDYYFTETKIKHGEPKYEAGNNMQRNNAYFVIAFTFNNEITLRDLEWLTILVIY